MTVSTGAALYDLGCHMVLWDKATARPCWRGYLKRRAPGDVVDFHRARFGDGSIAVIPWSLKSTGVDVDYGDAGDLIRATLPYEVIPSRRGPHLWFDDDRRRRNGNWRSHGCRGQVRSTGLLIPKGDGLERLAAAHSVPRPRSPFPADLFEAAGVVLPATPAPAPATVAAVKPRTRYDGRPLEEIMPGGRHAALFDVVRFWAYAAVVEHKTAGGAQDAWHGLVMERTRGQNARFPVPQPDDEIGRQAYSIASWCWSGYGPVDHSPEAQRRRGVKSGYVRRAKVAERDGRIVERALAGEGERAIAKAEGVGRSTVHDVLRRDAPLLAGRGGAKRPVNL